MRRLVQVISRNTFSPRMFLAALVIFLPGTMLAQNFSCPVGKFDMMAYFVMNVQARNNQFMSGHPNSIFTEVYPNRDFATSGYWLWLKSPSAHGFDVKTFDSKYVYMRSTELHWTDNTSFKRFVNDLPIAARCVSFGQPGPKIKVPQTTFKFYSSCTPYKSKNLGTVVNDLDAPKLMNAGGNLGKVSTRVLHYHFGCDSSFGNCR
ncbi:MAG: hypothetical protein M3O09_04130, partial [Acidobacteriota bacterium]|nr:hypothetical protein [Acidobacteriota bacterium]